MSKKDKHTEKKARRKWPWILLLCLLAFVALARLALIAGPVQQWIRQTIVDTANEQLAPELNIGSISGDLWKEVILGNITLREDSTVASIDTLHVQYDVWSYFGEAFEVQEIRLVNPYIKLAQHKDSTWNVQHWMTATDTSSASFAFDVADLSIQKGQFDVSTIQMAQDSSFTVADMNLSSRMAYYGDHYEATLRDLNFNVQRTKLDAPITVVAAAKADSSTLTLEKLAIATGQSVLNATAKANLDDSTVHFQADASPVGWRDLASYAEDLPFREDVNLSVGLQGSASDFSLNIEANARGIEALALQTHFELSPALTVTSFQASARQLDLQSFTGDTSMPRIRRLEVQSQGRLPLESYQQSQLEGTISVHDMRQGDYQLDQLEGMFNLRQNAAHLELKPMNGSEHVLVTADVKQVWDEYPALNIKAGGQNIDPENWLSDEEYAGHLSFDAEIRGTGWYPEDDFWDYQLTVDKSRLMEQQIDKATFSGRFNQQSLTNKSEITLAQSRLRLQAEADQLQAMPSFSYSLNIENMNLADLNGYEDYTSSITAEIRGKGKGSSLDDLSMQASMEMDSSIFRGESIQNIRMNTQVENAILTVEKGAVESDILAGTFSSRIRIQDLYNSSNVVDLDVQLKDITSLAALAEVDTLQAAGSVQGQLTANGQDSLVFESTVDLNEVNYDNQFSAPKIFGGLRVNLAEEPDYLVDIDVESPNVAPMDLQNISFKTQGQLTEQTTAGSFEIELAGQGKDHIRQMGKYQLSEDTTVVSLSTFDLTTDLRTLSLQRPFHAVFAGNALRTDTLHLSTADNQTFMELAVPYADSLHQQGYFKAKELNLKAIQDGILHESYFTGILSGELEVDRTDTSMTASSDVVMANLVYEETQLDTLRLEGNIEEENLVGMMELQQDGDVIVEGSLDIPFKAENPEQLHEEFFERPVSGALKLHRVKLSRFNTLLEQFGYENTEGTLQFDGSLKGKAGQPQLKAALSLQEAELSGVPVDSLTASVDYIHTQSTLDLNATLTSLKQKALEVDARMPLAVDLHSWEVGLPGPEDSIAVDVQTDQFKLKALNDFLDRSVARDLTGEINGQVAIRGPRDDLQASGEIRLTDGAVRVVDAGIRLDNIKSTVLFKPDQIELTNFRMKSGNGTLNGQGTLALEKLVPGEMDFSIKAENFKAANTDEYNGIINLDLQLDGEVSKPQLSGSIDVVNGFVKLDNFGEKSVEEVSLDTTLSTEPDISLYDSLSLDMDINFNRRFWVRNQRYLEMELELDGQIDMLKETGQDLQMFGTLNTANGYAQPLGKRFELEEGSLAFSGPPDNPQVNVRTLYEPPQAEQEIQIWYVIEGTVEEPAFKYESSPPMDLAGIISYTLFGQPFYKLNPAEQSVASTSSNNSAADFAVEVLLDRVEALATRRLGIDVVRIEQTRIGGDSGTSITTGWYINPKVFFAIQNVITGSTPTTGFFLEYYLKQNLKLILSQGNDNRQGIDLQWEHDY